MENRFSGTKTRLMISSLCEVHIDLGGISPSLVLFGGPTSLIDSEVRREECYKPLFGTLNYLCVLNKGRRRGAVDCPFRTTRKTFGICHDQEYRAIL